MTATEWTVGRAGMPYRNLAPDRYEDQGEPFWFGPGDLILQPSIIRHQVLECEAGSEVVEVCAPIEHTTQADPDTSLPTGTRGREWHGQRFLCDRATLGLADRTTAIEQATAGACRVAIADHHLVVEPLGLRTSLP